MEHWHRCERWYRQGLDCPFRAIEDDDPEFDDDDLPLPPVALPARKRVPLRKKQGRIGKGHPASYSEPLPVRTTVPLPPPPPPVPPSPVPKRVPVPRPVPPGVEPAPRPGEVPGRVPAPVFGFEPTQALATEVGQNVQEGARAVATEWRPTRTQIEQLMGLGYFRSRSGKPPDMHAVNTAYAEAVLANAYRDRLRHGRRRSGLRPGMAEEQGEEVLRKAGPRPARKPVEAMSRPPWWVLLAGTIARRRGGTGGMHVNMAARMRQLTAAPASRTLARETKSQTDRRQAKGQDPSTF